MGSRCVILHGKTGQKWRRAALWAGNVREVICEVVFNTRAQKPAYSLFVDRAYRRRCFAEWRHLFPPMTRYEALALVPHACCKFTSTNTRNRIAISSCREESKARSSIPAMFSQLLSALRTSPFFHLQACLVGTKTGKAGLLPVRHIWLACYKNVILSWLACKYKNVGESHRRYLHTGGNWP